MIIEVSGVQLEVGDLIIIAGGQRLSDDFTLPALVTRTALRSADHGVIEVLTADGKKSTTLTYYATTYGIIRNSG